MSSQAATPDGVNPHYLEHVLSTAMSCDVQASEDIIAGNGMKLLAKGARIDPAVRERLLQHKLRKPLEDCVLVNGGVTATRIGSVADELLEQHALLAALCQAQRAQPVPASLAKLHLSAPVQSLLSVYNEYQSGRLQHTVGVAMLALALARRLLPGEIDSHRTLALAGLVHDIGELYIDPQYLRRDAKLGPEQWRHIVTHPVVGHRVLRDMEGAGGSVADAVLLHHERLSGLGYPRGVDGERLTLNGQIVGAAEWLMALIESGVAPVARASMATRLIPGDFDAGVLETIAAAASSSDALRAPMTGASLEEIAPRIVRIAGTVQRFTEARAWIDKQVATARGELKRVLETGLQRMLRIQTAFASTGLNSSNPQALLEELETLRDPQLHLEVTTIVRELEWRLRELERDSLLRGSLLKDEDHAVLRELVGSSSRRRRDETLLGGRGAGSACRC